MQIIFSLLLLFFAISLVEILLNISIVGDYNRLRVSSVGQIVSDKVRDTVFGIFIKNLNYCIIAFAAILLFMLSHIVLDAILKKDTKKKSAVILFLKILTTSAVLVVTLLISLGINEFLVLPEYSSFYPDFTNFYFYEYAANARAMFIVTIVTLALISVILIYKTAACFVEIIKSKKTKTAPNKAVKNKK